LRTFDIVPIFYFFELHDRWTFTVTHSIQIFYFFELHGRRTFTVTLSGHGESSRTFDNSFELTDRRPFTFADLIVTPSPSPN
jgi:hypothetical protein